MHSFLAFHLLHNFLQSIFGRFHAFGRIILVYKWHKTKWTECWFLESFFFFCIWDNLTTAVSTVRFCLAWSKVWVYGLTILQVKLSSSQHICKYFVLDVLHSRGSTASPAQPSARWRKYQLIWCLVAEVPRHSQAQHCLSRSTSI